MNENSEKNLQEMFDGNASVDETKARDFTTKESLTSAHILNLLYKRTLKWERKFCLSLPRTTLLCRTLKTF